MTKHPRHKRITAEEVYNFFRDYHAQHGMCPTVKEASDHFGHSGSNITYHLSRLEMAGCIKRQRGYARGVELTDKPYSALRSTEENRWRHELLDFLEGKNYLTIADLRRRFTTNTAPSSEVPDSSDQP